MSPAELGFLLLTSHLGDPDRRPLTPAQLERVWAAVRLSDLEAPEGEVTEAFLLSLGLPAELAARVPELLRQEGLARSYLDLAHRHGIRCLTRRCPDYPAALVKRMGIRAPGVLWLMGEGDVPQTRLAALVGSRELRPENRFFAQRAGRAAAAQGYTLVSGNAVGADSIAQYAALTAGGRVISVLPGPRPGDPAERQSFLWEDSFDLPFSAPRALSRNHIIHALADLTLVAQVSDGTGGTWAGSVDNLRQSYSPLFVFDDGAPGTARLVQRGAQPIRPEDLSDLSSLGPDQQSLFL